MIKIGNKVVGDGHPILIIAEAANNHGGRFNTAVSMVKVAAEMGADAIKFQCWTAEDFAVASHSYYDLYKKVSFTKKQWKELRDLAKEKNLLFFIDVLDEASLNLMDELKIDAFKIHAGDIDNHSFIEKVAKKGRPVFLHTGSANYDEIKKAAVIIKKYNKNMIPFFGFQDYPTNLEQLNLNFIRTLKKELSPVVSFMDHTTGVFAPVVAVGVGANIIEKHFSLNRKLKDYDWQSSVEPDKFKTMVKKIRDAEKTLGSSKLILSDSEKKWLPVIRKHIVAKKEIKKGQRVKKSNIAMKRSKPGLKASELNKVLGKVAMHNISKDNLILEKDLK